MKINILKDELLAAANTAKYVVPPKTSMDILEGVKLYADNGRLTVSASNLQTFYETSIAASVAEPGEAVINSIFLADAVKLMDEDISISVSDNIAEISSGSTKVKTKTYDPNQFPANVKIDGEDIKTAKMGVAETMSQIEKTMYVVEKDGYFTKPTLSSIYIKFTPGQAEFVAVSNYRLALSRCDADTGDEFNMLVPIEQVKVIHKLLKNCPGENEIEIAKHGNIAIFKLGDTIITTRLMEGEFVDYEGLIPSQTLLGLEIDRSAFLASLAKMELAGQAGDSKVLVIMDIDGSTINISAKNTLTEVKDTIECTTNDTSQKLHIGYNLLYLTQAVENTDSNTIIFNIANSLGLVVIKPKDSDNQLSLVLPVKLAN